MKKLNKLVAILVAMAMVLSLSIIAAFADDVPTAQGSSAYLTKYLKIPEGVTIPNTDFSFHFKPVASTTVPSSELGAEFNKTLNTSTMAPSASDADDGALVGNLKVIGNAEEKAAGTALFVEADFPHYGEYVYEVTENQPANTEMGTYADNFQKYVLHIYYSAEGFEVTVLDNTPTEDTTTDPATPLEDEEGNTADDLDDTTTGDKKDAGDQDPSHEDEIPADDTDPENPIPGEPEENLEQGDISQFNVDGFTFVNKYTVKDDYNTELNDKGAFYAQKNTGGNYGDKTAAFPVKITVNFNGYKGEKALDLFTNDNEGNAVALLDENNNPIVLTKDTGSDPETWSATVMLKDGEYAYFKHLPSGAVVTVSEDLTTAPGNAITNADAYAQTSVSETAGSIAASSYVIKNASGADVTDQTVEANVKSNDNKFTSKITASDVAYADAQLTNDQKTNNSVKVTNTSVYEPSTTGILMSNLPYIALALVAIGGLVAYVVVRRRQDDEA